MLSLRMTRTVDGSLNGRDARTYQAGECYDLPDDGPQGLAGVFLREGWAELVVEAAPEPAAETAPVPPVKRSRRR